MTIKVSVLVPICNVDKFLRECLQSAVDQTLKDIEFICMNDGSTDQSAAILDEFAAKYPQIKPVHKENEGYGISMNRALALATGEYVGILESDDIASKDMFECLYTLAKTHEADAVRSNYYTYTSFPEPHDAKNFHMNDCHPYEVYCPREKPEIFFQPPAIWSGLYKRSFLTENKIDFTTTPGASYQDTAFNFKVWACANRIATTDRAFLHYRCDNENSSVKSKTKTYFVNHEMHEIERFTESRPDLKPQLQMLIPAIKYKTYKWNLDRITPELRPEYFETITKELKEDEANGFIDINRFRKCDQEQASIFFSDPALFFEENYGHCSATHSILIVDDGTHGNSFKRTINSLQRQNGASYEAFYMALYPNPLRREEVHQLRNQNIPITYVDPSDTLELNALTGSFTSVVTPLHRFKKGSLSKIEKGNIQAATIISSATIEKEVTTSTLFKTLLDGEPLPAITLPTVMLSEIPLSSLSLSCGLHLSLIDKYCGLDLIKTAERNTPLKLRLPAPQSSQYRKYHKLYLNTLSTGTDIYERNSLGEEFRGYFSKQATWLSESFYLFGDNLDSKTEEDLSPSVLHLPARLSAPLQAKPEINIVVLDRGISEYTNECLKSALNQRCDGLEVICITKDESQLDSKLLKLTRVLNISPGLTTGEAWNQGMIAVRSPYVIFVDGNGKFATNESVALLLEAIKSSNSNVCVGSQLYGNATTSEKLRANGNILGSWHTENPQCCYKEHQFDTGLSRILFNTEFLKTNNHTFKDSPCYSERLFIVETLVAAKEFHCLPEVTFKLNNPKEFTMNVLNMTTAECLVKDLDSLLSISKKYKLDWIHVSAFDSFTRHAEDIEAHLSSNDLLVNLVHAQGEVSAPLLKTQSRAGNNQTILYPIIRIGDWLDWKDVKASRVRNSLTQTKKDLKQLQQENEKLLSKPTPIAQPAKQNNNLPKASRKKIKAFLRKLLK